MTFMLQYPPVLKSFLAIQKMEAETCTATHSGIPTSDVRRGADSKNYYAVIIAPTFISNQDEAVYSIVQASFFIHINQACFSLDSCTVKYNPDPLHHVILNEEERKMSYYLGRYYVDIRSPCKYQKNILI